MRPGLAGLGREHDPRGPHPSAPGEGRAQLAVDFFDDTDEGYLTSESVDVPGLRFDRERGEVIYESDGSVLTCARRQKILWGTRYKETGACRISVRSEKPLSLIHI